MMDLLTLETLAIALVTGGGLGVAVGQLLRRPPRRPRPRFHAPQAPAAPAQPAAEPGFGESLFGFLMAVGALGAIVSSLRRSERNREGNDEP